MEEWRLLDTEYNSGYYNMAVDEAIMKASRKKLVPPTIRFYQWSPPALSLGYSQKGKEVVDRKSCARSGVDVVRRLTGGRTILHDDELTYSIVLREEKDILPDSIIKSYKVISRGMVKGLKKLNLPVELKPFDKNKKKEKGFSAACFDAPSWYEVLADGKKLIGSAQTRRKGIILQHNYIPFTIKADKIYSLLKMKGNNQEKLRKRMIDKFQKKATALNTESEEVININELKKVLKKGWEEEFQVSLKWGELIPQEEKWIKQLVEKKYLTDEWNYRI